MFSTKDCIAAHHVDLQQIYSKINSFSSLENSDRKTNGLVQILNIRPVRVGEPFANTV